jgi:hypothetical protein
MRLTIKDLLAVMSTLRQYDVLARADRHFANQAGRYYGGPLTIADIIAING